MTRRQEIDNEIIQLVACFTPQTHADFEIPHMVYAQVMKDNETRKKPYRVSYDHIQQIMHEMRAAAQN
jgi:hypothetical protein